MRLESPILINFPTFKKWLLGGRWQILSRETVGSIGGVIHHDGERSWGESR